MPDKPLLSICIPTYNRAPYLRECLQVIFDQLSDDGLMGNVEVLVSDNASEDATEEVVGDFIKKYDNIQYFKNKLNVGSSRNGLILLDRAEGEYFWMIGDDDIIAKGALHNIISFLLEKKYAAMILNFSQGEHHNPRILIKENSLSLNADKIYNDYRRLFAGSDFKNFCGINFVSAIIYRLEAYRANRDKISPFFNTCYVHAYIFLFVAMLGPILRIAKPAVIWRVGLESRRYDDRTQRNEEQVRDSFRNYVLFSKTLGYVFDESLLYKRDSFCELKHKLYITLKKFHLIKAARLFYRVPRLLKYLFSIIWPGE